jgi:hypothetical protein
MILVTCRPETEGEAWAFRFHAERNFGHRPPTFGWRRSAPERARGCRQSPARVRLAGRSSAPRARPRGGEPVLPRGDPPRPHRGGCVRRDGERWVASARRSGGPARHPRGVSPPASTACQPVPRGRSSKPPWWGASSPTVRSRARGARGRNGSVPGPPPSRRTDPGVDPAARAPVHLQARADAGAATRASGEARRALHAQVAAPGGGRGERGATIRALAGLAGGGGLGRARPPHPSGQARSVARPEAVGHHWQALICSRPLPGTPGRQRQVER